MMFSSWELGDGKKRLFSGGDCSSQGSIDQRSDSEQRDKMVMVQGFLKRRTYISELYSLHQTVLAFAYLGTMPVKNSRK